MNVRYDINGDVLIVEIVEQLSPDVYDRAIEAVLKAPEFHPDINVIYDLRDSDVLSLTTQQVRTVASRAKNLPLSRGTSWKAAIVVSGILAYGLGRMFEHFNDDARFEVRVFRLLEDAQAWVAKGIQ